MMSITTKPVERNYTSVVIDFAGDFDELVNAADAVLHDLTVALFDNCPESQVADVANLLLDSVVEYVSESLDKKTQAFEKAKGPKKYFERRQ